ncbi:hypothetical protein O181_022613 [Austropuccinia psidii MF-1]|uniref:Uncharacterized protein n=1 Tax=Austropuccinia psidii MF-1 TaxID=1389203 RepID=A0A9Q3CFI1_9BASI|nr:hypothetical protein [Austropuccinia psidii MF-1]
MVKMRNCHKGPIEYLVLVVVTVPSWKKSHTPQEIVNVEESLGSLKNIMKTRNIRINGKYHEQYLVRFKIQTTDKDKWLAEYAIPDASSNLKRLRASWRAEQFQK